MDEPRALRSALTHAGVTRYIKVGAFIGQGFAILGDLENINTLSQLVLIFKTIRYGRLLQPGDIPFSITALVSIKAFWFWINDRRKKNQYRMGGDFDQAQRNELHEIYRDVQERDETKHYNKWVIPKWESKTILPEWDDFLLNVMENDKLSVDKHTTIQYPLLEY